MKRILTAALLAAIGLCIPGFGVSASSLGDETIAIENARIVTGTGSVIDRGTVVIVNGKIAAVGATVDVPSGAKRIDATGLSVYPGFIDSATTLGIIEVGSISATTDVSEIGDYNPQLFAFDAYNPASELIPAARVTGVTSAVTLPDGGVLPGYAMIEDLNGWTVDQAFLKKSVGLAFSFPSGVGGQSFDFATFSLRTTTDADARKTRDKKLDEIKAFFDDARAYQKAVAAGEKDPKLPMTDTDRKLAALQPVLAGEQPLIIQTNDLRDVKKAVEFCEQQKVRMVLRSNGKFGTSDLAGVGSYLAGKKIAVIVGPMYTVPDKEDDRYDLPQELPAALARAGVKFAFASEDSAQVCDLPFMAAMAVAYGGLSKDDAVRALTVWPAEIWGVSDRVGSIEVGKFANLFVATGDPLDIRTEVKQMFIEGRSVSLESRRTRFYEEYKNRTP